MEGVPQKKRSLRIKRLLNDRQRQLLEFYLTVGSPAFGNATKAAKLAGYSPRSAYQIA